MPRTKIENPKVHITATISPVTNDKLEEYRKDEKNRLPDGNKPTRSGVVQDALDIFLKVKPNV
jgi:hypothetical protein